MEDNNCKWWCIGIGRPHAGPGGVVRSYEEARGTVELADITRT